MKKRLHIIVSGRVQGVWFRASTRDKALNLGLAGQVWNRADGRVEIIAEGREDDLRLLLRWCEDGSAGARVDALENDWAQYSGDFDGFEIV